MTEPHHDGVVTQEDVARRAGVSRAMVSYVLNNGPRKVSEDTRARVLLAIEELGYRPNKHAQRLKLGDSAVENSIGVIAGGEGSNMLKRPYYNVILAGLFDTAHQLNQHIRFISFFESLKDPVFFNKNIHREEISSLLLILPELILADPDHKKLMPQIMERIDNIVCLESSIYNLPSLFLDRAAAAQLAVEHLIERGHSRIGYIALKDERVTGYKRALLMHQIAFEPRLLRILDASQMLASAYAQTLDLVREVPDLTAISCANDESAIAAMAALRDYGLRVPEDVAITSIDNTEIASMIRPALTTVNIPIHEMGDYALRFLISQRQHPIIPAASMLLPIELVVRESSGGQRQPVERR